jgi:hypothetical protein
LAIYNSSRPKAVGHGRLTNSLNRDKALLSTVENMSAQPTTNRQTNVSTNIRYLDGHSSKWNTRNDPNLQSPPCCQHGYLIIVLEFDAGPSVFRLSNLPVRSRFTILPLSPSSHPSG